MVVNIEIIVLVLTVLPILYSVLPKYCNNFFVDIGWQHFCEYWDIEISTNTNSQYVYGAEWQHSYTILVL